MKKIYTATNVLVFLLEMKLQFLTLQFVENSDQLVVFPDDKVVGN